MKKIIAIIAVALVLFTATASAAVYPRTFKVYDLDYTNDVVTLISFNGDLYTFYGCEDWFINDCASAVMDDMGTPEIDDDKIVIVYYDAWNIESWE